MAVWREEQKPNRQEPKDANARPLNRNPRNTTDKSKTESKQVELREEQGQNTRPTNDGGQKVAIESQANAATAGQRDGTNSERGGLEEINPPGSPPRASLPARALSVGRRDAVSSDFWRRALTRRCISCLSGVLSGSAKRPREFLCVVPPHVETGSFQVPSFWFSQWRREICRTLCSPSSKPIACSSSVQHWNRTSFGTSHLASTSSSGDDPLNLSPPARLTPRAFQPSRVKHRVTLLQAFFSKDRHATPCGTSHHAGFDCSA